MNKVSFRIKVRDLPPEQAARLLRPLDPEGDVEITIEEVADFSDVPQDILDSQYEGLLERMKTFEPASDEEVEAFFAKYTKSKT